MKVIRTAVLVAAASAAVRKAREYARDNPEKASQSIDQLESFISGKAGPQYADKVGKGGHALRSSLGLPKDTAGQATAASPPPAPAGEPTNAPESFDPSI